jgi:hypothetical protein
MKITFIGHASILIETRGLTILSDPWWRGPCFGAQWWNFPLPDLASVERRRIDYVYISHGHHDHLHPGTLRTLSCDAKVLVSSAVHVAAAIRDLGFEVVELEDHDEIDLGGGVRCRIVNTYGDDTLMAVSDGEATCINLNDALHSAPAAVKADVIARLKSLYPTIDYVFCGYGVASHFPNCYEIPGKNRTETAVRRQQYFNRSWAALVAQLAPRFAFPFAADVVFLEDDLFWVNEPTHRQRPTDTFAALHAQSPVRVLDIAPGFCIDGDEVVRNVTRQPLRAETLRSHLAEQIDRANRYGRVTRDDVEEVAALMDANIAKCERYLASYEADYRFLVRFRNSTFGIAIEKAADRVRSSIVEEVFADPRSYDVVYRTRLPYLKWAYTQPYGDEVLFVGSGGVFEYADQRVARRNLHRELKLILTRQSRQMAARPGAGSSWVQSAKRAVRRLVRRSDDDLYDLGRWTVFGDRAR